MYRCMFAAGCSLVLGLVYGYGAGLLADEGGLWGLSAGTGAMSGALFTLTVSARWRRVYEARGG